MLTLRLFGSLVPGNNFVIRRFLMTHTAVTCWKCNKVLSLSNSAITCPCDSRVILPPTTTNYFDLFEW